MNTYENIINKISRKVDDYLSNLLAEKARKLGDIEKYWYTKYPAMYIYDTVPFLKDCYLDVTNDNRMIINVGVPLEHIERYVDLELTQEERSIIDKEGFKSSEMKIKDYFKIYTSDSFFILNQKTFYTMEYNEGLILAGVENQYDELILELWYKLTEDYSQISYIVGIPISDNSVETIRKEIIELIDNGHIDEYITMFRNKALENGWL